MAVLPGSDASSDGGTDPGYKNTEPGSMFTILRVPTVISPVRSADDDYGKVF